MGQKKTAENPVIVIGAGPAGLACAAELRNLGIPCRIFEKESVLAPVWRKHYDRLHLHTHRFFSSLPGLPMPRSFPKYPSRKQVITYLENYAENFGITPEFETRVKSIRPNGHWNITTNRGKVEANQVVVGTGMASFPFVPAWQGTKKFAGKFLHSSQYRNPEPFRSKRVLVVGFGNSGGEIAMDLADHGVDVGLSVRGPVNIVPRDILGIPILALTIAQQSIPYKLADMINKPVVRALIGDISRLGLQKSAKGPMAQVMEDGRIPLLDIGTVENIKTGKIKITPDIRELGKKTIQFVDGSEAEYDAIIAATGFRPDLRKLLPENHEVLNEKGAPLSSGIESAAKGLYFCSFRVSPTGQLREMGIEAQKIARSIASNRQ